MKEIKVTMLGPSSVGKTSLLAAIYHQYKTATNGTDLQIIPDETTKGSLNKRLEELKKLNDFETTGWMRRTTEEKSYTFELCKRGGKTFAKLIFQDYPGEWLNENHNEHQKVEKFLKESTAVIIAIDTPALMEKKAGVSWHKQRNYVDEVTYLFEKVYRELNAPKLVIFAPVRCERYYLQADKKYEPELLNRFKCGYDSLLNHFDSSSLISKVSVVVTPVQTVGNVVFNSIDIDETGEPRIIFNKISKDYHPLDSEQPLRYLLRFVLSKSIQSRWGIFNWLRKLLDLDANFKTALNAFTDSSMCKNSDGFEIIQGHHLLDV